MRAAQARGGGRGRASWLPSAPPDAQIAANVISDLIALINEHIELAEESEAKVEVSAHFRNLLSHIEFKRAQPDGGEMYASLRLKQ